MIESALSAELQTLSGMNVWPLLLPAAEQEGLTFQRISDPEMDGGMARTGLIAGRFQISMYRVDDYTGLVMLDKAIWREWQKVSHGSIGGYPVQYVQRGNILQDSVILPNSSIQYRLVRDFTLYFFEDSP
ncbi:hypothetical protein [Yokenella regensburgei]|uniref:hypothetical protein n=1 Tax=Yokenella regensburgei TaxID=158877 RepID=UPI001432EAD3|nr:hypothetical protein [Yokenella regensburgei]QIU89324.1 hypothetical protein HEC60_08285 [Yokenella regensburgei]